MHLCYVVLCAILLNTSAYALFRENDDGKNDAARRRKNDATDGHEVATDKAACSAGKDIHCDTPRTDNERRRNKKDDKGNNVHTDDAVTVTHHHTKRTHTPHVTHPHTHRHHKHKNSNFTTDKKFKKEEVFVIDQGDFDDSDPDNGASDESDDNFPIGKLSSLSSDDNDDTDDVEDVTGDRKGTINRAEDIVLDEDTTLGSNNNDVLGSNNNDALTQSSRSLPPETSADEIINDSLKDGSSTQFLESNQMIRSNELKGNYFAMNSSPVKPIQQAARIQTLTEQQGVIESPQLEPESLQLAQTLQKQVTARPNRMNFYKDISSPAEADPAMNKVISSDFSIDKSISRAIAAQMEKDNALTQTEASNSMKKLNLPSTDNDTATGDFANIVEQATKGVENEQNKVKPNYIFSPISSNSKPDNKLLESLSDKLHSPLSSFERFNQPLLKQNEPDERLEVNPGMSSLSPSEQQLISSLDEAVRSKDVATEVATKILMPMKEETISDRSVSPNEQLLDMLSKGKFQKPLPDEILSKLSSFDPNKLYMQEEGLSAQPMLTSKFAKVGQEYIPVHSVGINMPKTTGKPVIDAQQMMKAEQLMKTDPSFLAQNHQILNANNFNSLQDLSKIGEAILPNHVVDFKQPPPVTRPVHRQRPLIHHVQRPQILQRPHILHDLPERIAKILADYRAKQKPPKNFEDALSDAPNHNSADRFIPEKAVVLADEHKSSPQCKWNPCLNGGLCTAHPDKYYCSCRPGWIGLNCEKRSNCFPNPCNHGTCWPNIDGFTCTCKLGYKGARCDMLDRCRPNPCKNHGTCSETIEGVACECAIGFKGRLCEMESKCEPINPCMNGGTCREFYDRYHCACSNGFRGQNCEVYIPATKPPPTIPIKHEGPQAIPAPDNLSSGELHEIFTEKYTDSSGKIVTTSHESYGPSYDGSSDPGSSLVPHHPLPIKSPMSSFSDNNPLSETSHGEFGEPPHGRVGTPTSSAEDNFIVHSADEKESKQSTESNRKMNSSDITGNDDRYQTHLVQVGKNTDSEAHIGVHVGKAIPETSASISPSNPHPVDADGERGKQMNIDSELRVQDAHEGQLRHVEEVQEVYVEPAEDKASLHLNNAVHSEAANEMASLNPKVANEMASLTPKVANEMASLNPNIDHGESIIDTSSLHLNEVHGYKSVDNPDNSQTVIVNNAASTRSSLPKSSTTEKSSKKVNNVEINKNSTKAVDTSQSNAPKRNPHPAQPSVKKLKEKVEDAMHQETLHVNNVTKTEHEKADDVIQKINTRIQETKIDQMHPSFSRQKDAYSAWRRKALINFHKRNPNKPLPKNTLSLSKNSLCPKFCRLFCDPWCVKIGCCKTTKDQQKMFQEIEKEHTATSEPKEEEKSTNFMIIEADPCDKCNENADCHNKRCSCKTGFHGDGVTCTIDNCLLCHLDAECAGERCVCKKGFFGDGYECKSNVLQKKLCSRCHRDADCIGGDCLCARGFFGNGTSCWPLPIPV